MGKLLKSYGESYQKAMGKAIKKLWGKLWEKTSKSYKTYRMLLKTMTTLSKSYQQAIKKLWANPSRSYRKSDKKAIKSHQNYKNYRGSYPKAMGKTIKNHEGGLWGKLSKNYNSYRKTLTCVVEEINYIFYYFQL